MQFAKSSLYAQGLTVGVTGKSGAALVFPVRAGVNRASWKAIRHSMRLPCTRRGLYYRKVHFKKISLCILYHDIAFYFASI